jgi:hypothetical protein
LKSFDFTHITHEAVKDPTKLIKLYRSKGHPPIQLGSFGIIKYSFAPEALAPSSLNPENAAAPPDSSMRELLKNLRFINSQDKGPGTPRLALALGRLTATHFDPDRVSQSHWVILLDQTRLLWACYAYGIDTQDIKLDRKKKPGPYIASGDNAFCADRPHGQKVVFLGPFDEVPFEVGKELNSQVHDLDWSTTPVSQEQILAMPNENTEMKDTEVGDVKGKGK